MSERPSDLEHLFGYVRAFELAQAADAWPLIEPCFAEDAEHIVHEGGPLGGHDRGRAAVVEGLRQSVLRHDRRFDVRIAEVVEGPLTRPDGVWMRWNLTLRRAGVPELRLEGEHVAEYADGRICRLEEWLPAGSGERVERFVAEHAERLKPAGSPPALPGAADLRDLEAATARSLARCYAGAKSERDAGAALFLCSDDFVLETLPFGTRARGRVETAAQLALFFHAFPDYSVELEGFAQGDRVVAAWGRARLSFRGELLGQSPTGKTADLPIFCLLGVEGGVLRSERFFFDRAELCEQTGLEPGALAAVLSAVRAGEAGRGA
jgi:predicted ester cyclase